MTTPENVARIRDMLEYAGIDRRHGEPIASSYIVPEWWFDTEPPEPRCRWCQRPTDDLAYGEDMCRTCFDGIGTGDGPRLAFQWYATLTPPARRLHIGIKYGIDPWSLQPCTISVDTLGAEPPAEDGTVVVALRRSRVLSPGVPWMSWDQDTPAG